METVAGLLRQAADIARQVAELADKGDISGALALEQQADGLRARARRLAHLERAPVDSPNVVERQMGARQVVLAALAEIGVPVAPKAIADYALARFGVDLEYRAITSLRRDERRAWGSQHSHRPSYAVPALEGRRFLAMRGKLSLSDWPLERRIIGPWSERVDHLTATVNLTRFLEWLQRSSPTEAARIVALIADYANSIPGALTAGEPPDAKKITEAAAEELAVVAKADIEWRDEAASRARLLLSEEEQLWGARAPETVWEKTG